MDALNILQTHKPFSALEPDILKKLADESTRLVALEQGEELTTEDIFGKVLGIAAEGKLCVYKKGGEKVLMNKLSDGALFGAANLFGGHANFVTRIFAETKAEVLLIDGGACEKLVKECPDFAEAYITFLTDRIRFLNGRISDLTLSGAEKKLAAYLAKQPDFVKPNRSKLSQLLNVGRASLYRAIDSLEARKTISKEDDGYRIINREELERIGNL